MFKKWFSIKKWWQVISRIGPLLLSRRIPLYEKLWFLLPVGIYWIIPADLIPFFGIDDVGVMLILMRLFADRVERKYIHSPSGQ